MKLKITQVEPSTVYPGQFRVDYLCNDTTDYILVCTADEIEPKLRKQLKTIIQRELELSKAFKWVGQEIEEVQNAPETN